MVDRRSLLSPAAASPARRARPSNNYAEFFGANDSIDDILGEGKGEDGYGGDGAYMTLDAQALDTPFSPQGETDGLEPSREERCLRCVRCVCNK